MSLKEVNSNVQLTPEMEAHFNAASEMLTYKENMLTTEEMKASVQEFIDKHNRLGHKSRVWRRWNGFEPELTTTPELSDDHWDVPEDTGGFDPKWLR